MLHTALMIRLGWAGALPFVALTLLLLFTEASHVSALAVQAMLFYGVAILSFIAGIWWGQSLAVMQPGAPTLSTMAAMDTLRSVIASNLICVAGWLTVIILPVAPALMIMGGLFATALLLENILGTNTDYTPTYRSMRARVTTTVVACHLIALLVY